MFNKLKERWKVNGVSLILIIATFALGGSLCGYAGRKLLLLTNLEKGLLWFVLYIVLITLLWPLCVMLISIPLGQFSFFKRYILRIWGKMSGKSSKKSKNVIKIAIFASGTGSNAEKIIEAATYLLGKENHEAEIMWKVALIVCNKPGAGVLDIALKNNIPTLIIEKERFFNADNYLPELKKYDIGFIVLAGFLWKMPANLIAIYTKKIINIHPALLPKFGGKGMYGSKVHHAVIDAKETESGITIHYVDELYDHGEIIFQAKCPVSDVDTPETLAAKVHLLEHKYYPQVLTDVIH